MAYIALFLAMIFWGTSFAITKESVVLLDPIFVMFIRLTVAAIFFILCIPFFPWKKIRASIQPGDTKLLILLVLCEPCFYFIFETYALKYTTASAAGVITGIFPLTISAGAWLFFRERAPWIFWAGCLLAVAGVMSLTLVSHSQDVAPNPLLGNSLMIGAIFLGTAYTLLASKLSIRINPAFLTALQAWGGTIFYLILCMTPLGKTSDFLYSETIPFGHWPQSVTPEDWRRLIYLGLFVSVGSYGLFVYSVSKLPATTIAILINFIPVLAVIFAVVHLNESISHKQLIAISTVFVGVLIASISKRKPYSTN